MPVELRGVHKILVMLKMILLKPEGCAQATNNPNSKPPPLRN